MSTRPRPHRAPNGIFYRIEGDGEPLLMLHGLMVSGAMFDPLVDLLRDRFRMLIPDLRGHGRSGDLSGPYEVPQLAADLPVVMAEAGFDRAAVMGYSHGGAVAQQFAHTHPACVSRLMLVCTYACNVSTMSEWLECQVALALLGILSPATIARIVFRPAERKRSGAVGLTPAQAEWMRGVMAANRRPAMRQAAKGLATFDSRPWLKEIRAPTLVVGAAQDEAVPRHHYDMLVSGIPGARARLVDRASHAMIWTHTRELADILSAG